jgi:hypothetical protein
MATIAKKGTPDKEKQNLALEIAGKLEAALEDFKEIWGEKKFRNRIKKASKIFLKGKPKKIQVTAEPAPAKKKAANRGVKKQVPAKK